MPEAPTPPNGIVASSLTVWSLMCTRPVGIRSAISRPRVHVPGQDAERQPVLGAAGQLDSFVDASRTAPRARPGRRSPRRTRARSAAPRRARSAGRTARRSCRRSSSAAPASTLAVTIRCTLSRCRSSISGPSATWSGTGRRPAGGLAARPAPTAYSFATELCTRCLLADMQIWPWWMNEPNAPTEVACSTSTSSSTISAELPPSSRCTRFRCSPASLATARPALVDPVNAMIRTSGLMIMASPTSAPPGSTCSSAVGQPGRREQLGEQHAAADRGARVRLEHHGVAERECWRYRPDRQDRRHVERRDHADHSGRHPAGHAQPRLRRAQQLAVRLRGERGGLVALLGRHADLQVAKRRDGSGFPGQPGLDLVGVLKPQIAGLAQHRGPLAVRHGRPVHAALACPLHRCVDVGGARMADPAELLAGGRLGHRMLAARPVTQPPE